MKMAKYTDILNAIRKNQEIDFKDLGEILGKHQQTVRDKFKSDNVSEVIDMLKALNIKLIGPNGQPIGEEQTELINLKDIELTPEQFERFKLLLDKKED